MNNKIPCGGFYLSDTLGVDENGKLGVNGGEPYKSLVTDGEGNVKWEDRLAYDDSKVVVSWDDGIWYVKVADEVPSWLSVDASIKVWFNDGGSMISNPEENVVYDNGTFRIDYVFVIQQDNFEFPPEPEIVFPEKGVYFYKSNTSYVSGIASADSDTPEITWDGSMAVLKKIDKKYTGLLAFSILWDGTSNYSATASYQEVRDAYDAKLPIFANLFVNNACYPATEIMAFDNYLSFGCGTYGVSYSSDGTIGKTGPS